jgi:hypothetical protein
VKRAVAEYREGERKRIAPAVPGNVNMRPMNNDAAVRPGMPKMPRLAPAWENITADQSVPMTKAAWERAGGYTGQGGTPKVAPKVKGGPYAQWAANIYAGTAPGSKKMTVKAAQRKLKDAEKKMASRRKSRRVKAT